jgi:hypothetical protein
VLSRAPHALPRRLPRRRSKVREVGPVPPAARHQACGSAGAGVVSKLSRLNACLKCSRRSPPETWCSRRIPYKPDTPGTDLLAALESGQSIFNQHVK